MKRHALALTATVLATTACGEGPTSTTVPLDGLATAPLAERADAWNDLVLRVSDPFVHELIETADARSVALRLDEIAERAALGDEASVYRGITAARLALTDLALVEDEGDAHERALLSDAIELVLADADARLRAESDHELNEDHERGSRVP